MSNKPLVIVTGGTKGIGRATLTAFGQEGYDLVTCSRNSNDLTSLQTNMKDSLGVTVNALKADLSKQEDIIRFADYIESLKQPISALINNAGLFLPGEMLSEPDDALALQMNTNVYSVYHLSRRIIPLMMQQKAGHIFNICSTASNTAYTNCGSYCISKFALYGFSKVLREELKPHGIRVSSVLPGATLTDSWAGTELPEDRLMPPEDVATMILSSFKLSPRAVVEDIVIRPMLGDL